MEETKMSKLIRNDPVVFHFRLGKGTETEPKAGATVVFLPEARRFGVALCCYKDRYCKKWGRKIATERAEKGPSWKIRNRRFASSPLYSGSVEMKAIKASAQALAYHAAEKVGNPLVSEAPIFITEGEKTALKDIGLYRSIETIKHEGT